MEKTFSLDQKETQMLGVMEQENLRLNARYGQLAREREDVDRRIAASEEKQKTFLLTALANRGIEKCEAAQILNNQLVCRMADEPIITVNGESTKATEKPNGLPALEN